MVDGRAARGIHRFRLIAATGRGMFHAGENMSTRFKRDLLIIGCGAVLVFALSAYFDLFNTIIGWIYSHNTWQLDEFFTVAACLIVAGVIFAWRRQKELLQNIRQREKVEGENARLVPELERALDAAARLRKILPVCPACKRVRDAHGDWLPLEMYMEVYYMARLNDGLCPGCAREAYRFSRGQSVVRN
jgi:hypothetical protein